ncbi:MAG TPA: MCP four helix bundle domain-containing protein, partial [Rhodocyclaceae bacterium]
MKNLPIGVRLGLGFGFVLVLFIVVATLAVVRVGQISGEVTDMVNDKFPKTMWANGVIDNINVIARALRNSLLVKNPEDVAKEIARVDEARKNILENIGKLEKSITTEEGKRRLGKMLEARKVYVADQDKFIELQKAGKRDEAVDLLAVRMRGTQGAYIAAANELIDFQSELMKKSGEAAADVAATTQTLVISLAAAAIVLSTFFAWWVTRSITRPIDETVDVANALAQGDLTVKIEVDSKDETGKLKAAMQEMVGKLAHIIGEVRGASDNLSSAAQQVSATAQSLSQASSEQAASVEETTASIEQMTASITHNTENAKVTDTMATKSSQEATEGGAAVKETVDAMQQIAGKIGIIDDIA